MSVSASHAALPYPIKGARFTAEVVFLDADGDPLDPTTPDSEISKDNGAFADCAEEVSTASGSRGGGMITFTGAETDCSCAKVWFGVASGPKATMMTLYPRVLAEVGTGTLSAGSAGGGTLGTLLAYDVTGCFIKTTGGTGGGGTGGANNQARAIVTYNTTTGAFTVAPNWETTPSTDTTYAVLLPSGVTLGMLRTLNPTTPGNTLDVTATGEAGVDWGNVANKTTTNALTGTTIATTQKVDVETIKTNAVVNGGTVTFPTNATLASTTNITAGTITTATTATNVTTVNGLAANVITAASIASDAITAAKIADGAIDAATFAAGAINAAAIAADAITDAKVASDVTIASVTGAVGSVTGNVGGNVTGTVGGVAGTTQTLDALQTALNSAHGSGSWATATGFSTHSAADVWAVATRVLTAGTNVVLAKGTGVTGFNDLSAAQVNAEADTALADYDAPTKAELDSAVAPLATAAALATVGTNVSTLLTRITSTLFSGITSLANWLGALAGKTADSSTQTEIRATTAGASYTITTDSLEALRDRGDAAWATATGFSTLDAAGVRTAVGLASANLDTQLAAKQATFTAATGVSFPTNFSALLINASGHVTRVTTADVVTAATVAGTPDVNVTQVNGVTVGGTGASGDEWGPV